MRVELEPLYILHRRPYRESSLLLDALSLQHGRVALVAKGALSPRASLKAVLQPFTPLRASWSGKGGLKSLLTAETVDVPFPLAHRALYSALYLNELVLRLLPEREPVPEIFAHYAQTLHRLAGEASQEPALRVFEDALLVALGYGVHWGWCVDQDVAVRAGQMYALDPDRGILAQPTSESRLSGIPGAALLGMQYGDYDDPLTARVAKRLMRVLIDVRLNGQPLSSRALFSHLKGDSDDETRTARS